MEKVFRWIIRRRKSIIVGFLLVTVFCALCRPLVQVNYDITDYLPRDSSSTIALNVMEEEFTGGIPNAEVMIYDVTVPEALQYKEKLQQIDGVTDVTWLDDAVDITVPLAEQDADVVNNYYQDNTALFSVTVDDHKSLTAVAAIRELIGDANAMSGAIVSTAVATESTVVEIQKIAIIAVIMVLLILILTTDSWLEPILILAGLGVSILINGGTNLIFGEISFVTNAAGSILQLAICLDFSVFLIHRYMECRGQNADAAEDMVQALSKAGSAVFSSALTVMIGFLALAVMRFRIGPDLGLALAKGIAISLITVFTFTPALLVLCSRLVDKTRHRRFYPSFQRFGRLISKISVPLVCVFVLLPVPCFLASLSNDYYYGSSHIFNRGTQMGDDTAAIQEVFGINDTYVLLVPQDDLATQTELSTALQKVPQVTGIISYVDNAGAEIPTAYLDNATLAKLMSENYSRLVISVDADFEGEETFSLVQNIRSIAQQYYPDTWYLAGTGVSTYDLMDTVTADRVKIDVIAIGAVFIVLLLAMKSLSLPLLLVLAIETAIWFNMAIPYFNGSRVFYIAYLIINAIQLGATVDYAILLTDRYKEFRLTLPKRESVQQTIAATIIPILTSGTALTVCGFLMGNMTTHQILAQLGFFLGRGTLLSLFMVLFMLPGLLYVCDGLIQKTTLHARYYNPAKQTKMVSAKQTKEEISK